MSDKNLLEKSIEETVDEMKKKIDELTKETNGSQNKAKTMVDDVVEKASSTLSSGVDKIKEFAGSDEVKKTVSFIKEKASDLGTTTAAKFKELKESEEVKQGLKDVSDKVKQGAEFTMDKLSEGYNVAKDKINEELEKNENLKKVVDTTISGAKQGIDAVSQKVSDFMAKPEVAEKLDQVKEKSIDLAENALDSLKKWLGKDDKKG